MIENKYIDLSTKSELRKNAKGIIEFSLFLDYELPSTDINDSELIDILLKNTKKNCNRLLNRDQYAETYSLRFFGDCNHQDDKSYIFLDVIGHEIRKLKEDKISYYKGLYYPDLLDFTVDNCLLSAYNALATALYSNIELKPYTIKNKSSNFCLLDSLIYDEKDDLILSIPRSNSLKQQDYYAKQSSKGGTFGNKLKTKIESYTDLFSFLSLNHSSCSAPMCHVTRIITDSINNSYLFPLYSPEYRENGYIHLSPDKLFNCINNLQNSINKYKFPDKSPSERLYAKYILERTLNIDAIASLIKNINHLDCEYNYNFMRTDILEILSLYLNLPNVFTRKFFLQFAFDTILPTSKTNSYRDFWHKHDVNRPYRENAVMDQLSVFKPKGFQFEKWLNQFSLFMNLFSSYIMPICDWYFLCSLLEFVERKHKFSNEKKSTNFILHECLNILASYINENHERIENPFSSLSDIYTPPTIDNALVTEKGYPMSSCFNSEDIALFMNAIIPHCINTKLQMPLLDKDYILRNYLAYSSTNHANDLNNFYLNMFQYDMFSQKLASNVGKPDKSVYQKRMEDFLKNL